MCDCLTICPCWVGQPPDDGRCTGAFGWAIDEGSIGTLDTAGRCVVSVSYHEGHRDAGGQEVFVFVDDGASPEQFDALVRVFTGGAGGPLGELAPLMGRLRTASRAPIELTSIGNNLSVTVGRVIRGDAAMLVGPDGKTTELRHGRLSAVLGDRAEVGRSSTFRIDLGPQLAVEVRGRAAMRGAFSYEFRGT